MRRQWQLHYFTLLYFTALRKLSIKRMRCGTGEMRTSSTLASTTAGSGCECARAAVGVWQRANENENENAPKDKKQRAPDTIVQCPVKTKMVGSARHGQPPLVQVQIEWTSSWCRGNQFQSAGKKMKSNRCTTEHLNDKKQAA